MYSCFIHHVFTQMILQNIPAALGGGVECVGDVGGWGLSPVTCSTAQVRMNLPACTVHHYLCL